MASVVYLSGFLRRRDAQPFPRQECGQRPKPCCRSSPMYPTGICKSICLQNNKTESQQNSTSVKQQNSVSTQQRNSKTVTSVSQYFSQSVLTSICQSAFLNKTPPDLPFFVDFVPDVGFGNGWFASSDWPANKRERDVIFDPFLSPRNIICSGLSKLCFPLREIFSVTKTACPQGGGKLLRSRRFLQGTPCAETGF